MADADRPPFNGWLDDSGPDGPGSGEPMAVAPDQPADTWTGDWPEDATDEWTEPMARAATDPFDTPVRPAREHPDERPRHRRTHTNGMAARAPGAARRPGRPRATGTTVGAIGGLATAVAVAASLALLVVAPDTPPESRDAPREPRWFPISELAGPAATSEPAEPAAGAFTPLAPPADESAASAVCELDPLAPAPTLPAADPAPAHEDAATAGDRAASTPDESAPDDSKHWMVDLIREQNVDGDDPDDVAGDRQRTPGSEPQAP